jgi:hypothetical protein
MSKTINLSDGTSFDGILIVVNEYARGASERRRYRLYWENPGTSYAMPAYGLCSEPFFRSERDAIAQGEKDFGQRAIRRAW